MRKYFYEINRQERNLRLRQYIYWIGPYRYNWHEELELMLILKGDVELSCGGECYSLKEDDLIVIDSNVGHASLAKSEGSIAMVIHLDPAYLREYYSPVEDYRFFGCTDENSRDSRRAKEIRRMMAVLITRMDTSNPLEKLRFEQSLSSLLLLLFGLFPPRRIDRSEAVKTRKQKDLMERIVNFVEENYRERITLKTLGALCGYNATYLSTWFKTNIGLNFYDYLMRIRLREATLELCSTDKTILEVAGDNGFGDVKSFNLCFRKTFGKSPGEYRRQILAENKGMDFKEKRRFLPLDNVSVNEKLESYQLEFESPTEGGSVSAGRRLLYQEMAEGILGQTKAVEKWSRNLSDQLTEIRRKLEEMKRTL